MILAECVATDCVRYELGMSGPVVICCCKIYFVIITIVGVIITGNYIPVNYLNDDPSILLP